MQCPRCAAEVSVLREFCPKCGAPLHSDRDAGVTPKRSADDLRRRKKVVIGAAAVLLSIGVISNANWFDFDSDDDRRPQVTQHDEPRGAAVLTAEQLYQAFRDDPEGAERRFDDREMVVTGQFERIVPDGYGSLDLRLKTSNPDAPVGIDVADPAIDDAKKLRPGQQVTVSCQALGGVDDDELLWVRDCAIQAADAGASAPPAPEAPQAPEAPDAPANET